jgi:hypothetical protein
MLLKTCNKLGKTGGWNTYIVGPKKHQWTVGRPATAPFEAGGNSFPKANMSGRVEG